MDLRAIRAKLLRWYARAHRDLPWRRTRDPYRIWVSEIMLQQTRVAAALPYYERFVAAFPDVEALAAAPQEKLLALWSGLGYYSRARNLQKAARQIVERGSFPRTYEAIRELAGVGEYTAAAVASIAFDLPYAVLDGNVLRVLARLTNDDGEITSGATRKRLKSVAGELVDRKRPGLFNQAMMELGATVCLPKQPQCGKCPLAQHCEACRTGRQTQLPVKRARPKTIRIDKVLLRIERRGRVLLWQRPPGGGRMAGFWELPESIPGARKGEPLGEFRHTITHHHYRCMVRKASLSSTPRGFRWWPLTRLHEIPLSTTAKKALACSAGGAGLS